MAEIKCILQIESNTHPIYKRKEYQPQAIPIYREIKERMQVLKLSPDTGSKRTTFRGAKQRDAVKVCETLCLWLKCQLSG